MEVTPDISHIDTVAFDVQNVPDIDEVRVTLENTRDIDTIEAHVENREITEVRANFEVSEERIFISFFKAILLFINAIGEFFYRNNQNIDHCRRVQTAWSGMKDHSKYQEEMNVLFKNMHESDTRFYSYFLRNSDANSNSK